MSGFVKNGMVFDARKVFDEMANRNVVSWTAMLDGYAKCGRLDESRVMFDAMTDKNVVCWNVMLSGYVTNDEKMKREAWNAMLSGYVEHDSSRMVVAGGVEAVVTGGTGGLSSKGAVIGGVVGSVGALIILLIALLLWYRQSKRTTPIGSLYVVTELQSSKDYLQLVFKKKGIYLQLVLTKKGKPGKNFKNNFKNL
ncbi:pentatricopeptide repeat-containing protein At2g35030, mitochondrial-like [Helianthus annuus]|uniref:pentatricopeptide repeat-containing protein At2g35030, mitochondrial-like n=1 Tax=Helianthus annuus TaxID=4232 RepID=UPI001652C430|nr:pentatricopeptide repeat-containing protein At2g35030, mitochondrial-like [Helianthus annuus]